MSEHNIHIDLATGGGAGAGVATTAGACQPSTQYIIQNNQKLQEEILRVTRENKELVMTIESKEEEIDRNDEHKRYMVGLMQTLNHVRNLSVEMFELRDESCKSYRRITQRCIDNDHNAETHIRNVSILYMTIVLFDGLLGTTRIMMGVHFLSLYVVANLLTRIYFGLMHKQHRITRFSDLLRWSDPKFRSDILDLQRRETANNQEINKRRKELEEDQRSCLSLSEWIAQV